MKRGVSRKYNESSQDMHYQVIPEGIKLSPRIRIYWICPYISRHLLSLNPLLACCRRYSRGER